MALKTGGTNATTSLQGLAYLSGIGSLPLTDVGNLNNLIKDDLNVAHPVVPSCFRDGYLWVPNRGLLQVLPGDMVLVDSQGWPILLSKNSAANGPWTHT